MTRRLTISRYLANLRIVGDPANVAIYGPYAPQKGRSKSTKWRLVVVDEGARKTIAVRNEAEGIQLRDLLRAELQKRAPITIHDVLGQYLEYKKGKVAEAWLKTLSDRLRTFLPDVSVSSISPEKAEALYLAETKREGRFGPIKPASHHALLRNTKEFFGWLVKKGFCTSNPFSAVEPIGRPNVGKRQPRNDEARLLDELLFREARNGDEGALALLLAIYGGFRSSEVLSRTVADVDSNGRYVWIERGKSRNARRTVEIFDDVAELLHKHTKDRPKHERVFAANLPRQPKGPWMHKRLARFCKLAGITQVCPHALRGLNATLAIEGGAPTYAVATSLGHSSFEVTRRHYAEPSALDNAKNKRVVASLRSGKSLAGLVEELSLEERQALKKLLLD